MSGYDERDERAAAWAVKLSDEALSKAEQAEFQAWLDSDPANVDLLGDIVGAWQVLDRHATAGPMMALREEALASARRMRERRSGITVPRPPAWLLVAACVCLIFAGISIWYAEQPDLYSTGLGERRIVVLDDDSKLSLDAGTRVKVKYSSEGRKLWLEQGRAKFDVAKDPLRPFTVAARGKLVVATGTQFSVELVGPETRVILYEGHVAVLNRDNSSSSDILKLFDSKPAVRSDYVALDAGSELVLTAPEDPARARSEMVVRRPDDLSRSTDWETGRLVFDNETLNVVAARTNRYAERPIVLADDGVGQMRISGVFRAGDTESLVEGLAATLGVRSRDEGQRIVLSAPREPKDT